MKTLFSGRSDMPFAMLLLAPSLILLGGLVAWPMISNIEISFLRLPLNPRISAVFVGLDNYIRILSDAAFWHSLWTSRRPNIRISWRWITRSGTSRP